MARQATRKRAKRAKAGTLPNELEQTIPTTPITTPTHQIMTKMSGVKSNPYGETHAFQLSHMLAHIRRSATTAKAKAYASVKSIPEQARTSLALFFVDWGGNDINHEAYLNNTPDGFPKDEALKMGELLYWCIGGSKKVEGQQLRKGRSVSTEWQKIINTHDKNGKLIAKGKSQKLSLPAGVSIHDLTGLHIELLNMLPQRTYTHYTLNQLFIENRQMYDALFQDFVALNPMEHDTLQVMQRIVEQGNIERFRLAMMHGTQGKVRKMLTDGTFGANLIDAFNEAKDAVSAYKRGDYATARMGLEKLQLEYGLAPDLFQLGLSDMFVIHAATPIQKGKAFDIKGPNTQLLVSIDKSVGPDGGWPGIGTIRDRMSGPARKIAANGTIGAALPSEGTPGSRLFKNKTSSLISTDWVYFFSALNNKGEPKNASINKTDTAGGISEANRTVRLLIHARMDKGFEDLVPKGTILATIRPSSGTTQQRSSSRRSAQNRRRRRGGSGGGGGDSGGGGGGSQNGLIMLQESPNTVIGMVDLIFEDYGGLFDKTETKGGTFQSKDKPKEATVEQTTEAVEAQLTADIQEMQPENTSDLSGLLSRRSAKRHYAHFSEQSWLLQMDPSNQTGLRSEEDARDWAQALANRDQKAWYIYEGNQDVPHNRKKHWYVTDLRRSGKHTVMPTHEIEYENNPSTMILGLDYHDYIEPVKKILKKEGGAAGLKPLKAAFPKNTNKAQAQRLLAQMPGVVLHADGDYILVDTVANPPLDMIPDFVQGAVAGGGFTWAVQPVLNYLRNRRLKAKGADPESMKEETDEILEINQKIADMLDKDGGLSIIFTPFGSVDYDMGTRKFTGEKDAMQWVIDYINDGNKWTFDAEGESIRPEELPDYITIRDNPAKGGGRSMGQTIVIELTPKADLAIHRAREDAKWLKMIAKKDSEVKKLYDKYAKTSTRSAAQEGRVKKGKKKGEGITGGSYVVYKGNQTALKMIKAPRKDNQEFVPWLLMIPHILVRQGDDGKLIAKKGGASYQGTANLLEEVERYYGAPKFKTNMGMGGFRLISERTARKMKQSGSAGKKVVDLAVHEGVKKVFTTPGVAVELEGQTVRARADRYKIDGDIMYRARYPSSKKIVHFQQQSGGGN